MADSAVRFLMENIKQLLEYNRNLISGAENELRNLVTDLDLLRVYIRDAAKKEGPWGEREIKEVVYELEDTIDAHLTDAASAKTMHFGPRLAGSGQRHMKLLAEKLKDLRIRKVRPPLDACLSNLSLSDAPPSTSRKRQPRFRPNKVVGFEDEKETIIGYLIKTKEKLDFITITGMRGQGKTTLAREIYDDERIAYEFPIRFWTRVSPNSKYRDLFLNIMKVFSGQDMSNLNDQKLIETCQACLEKGKFLLVVDGVCRLDDWKAIKNILPHSNGKSKVLITTCNNYVGADNDSNRGHKLRLLTTRESWKLLQLEVFGNLEDCPLELEKIGKIIADKCGGLPLQIVAVGGILAGLGSIKMEWQKVSENKNLFTQNGISNAVELTYTKLPDDLRESFLFMGVFPEDYEIPVWTLTRLWIAEGFVQPNENGQSLEETATQNLYYLINRNLVMADRVNPIGEVKTCRIPDTIRAFCVQKAQEHNLFRDVKRPDAGVSQLQKSRRLCVHSDVNAFLSRVPAIPWVRSLLCFHKEHASSNLSISDAFTMLRVLESRSIKFDVFPTRITEVIHLRYITLSVDDLRILPRSLSKIWNLQSLVVDTASRVITMEADLWMLIGLRHLKTNAAIILLSDGEGKAGENLQTLNTLSPKSCTAHVSKRANNLKTLRIKGELSTLPKNKFLENFVGLEKLKLVNDLFPNQNPVHGLTLPNRFPPNLRRLTLSNTFLKWSHMSSTLAKINTLQVLKLKDNAFTGVSWRVEEDCFCGLQFLLIADADIAIWEASTDSLPRLTCLVLKNCGNLHGFPQTLKSIEKLEIERVNKSVLKCARRIAEQKAMLGFPIKLSIAPGHGF